MDEATAGANLDRKKAHGLSPPTLGGLEGEESAKETERKGSERQETKGTGDWRGSCPFRHMCPSCLPSAGLNPLPLHTRPLWVQSETEAPRDRHRVCLAHDCGPEPCQQLVRMPVRSARHQAITKRVRDSGSPLGHLPFEHQGHHPKPESFSGKQ